MQIKNGVSLHFIKTTKFKDIGITLRFRSALDKEHASARSLLSLMLCDRCEKYDTKQKIREFEDYLYGTTIGAQTIGYGKSQVLEIVCRFIDPSYLKEGNDLMEQVLSFLHEIVFHPHLDENSFNEAKMMLCAKIKRSKDDPSQFSISEGLKFAGKDAYLGISPLGELEIAKSLSLKTINETYEAMISKDTIDIIVCGDVDPEDIETKIMSTFPFDDRKPQDNAYYLAKNDLFHQCEKAYRNISQSYIMMTWFTNTSIVDDDYYVLRVINAMFGQYSTSLLFQEVREKHSLCYSIFSNLISYDGAMCVSTGIDKENIKKTIVLISEQLDKLVNDDFSEELFMVSKQMIVNSLRASKDNMSSLIALQYQNILLHQNYTTEDIILKVEQVSREDVLRVVSKLELKMTYVLTKEDSYEESGE